MGGFLRRFQFASARVVLWLRIRVAPERAQTLVEYALLLAFLVLAVAGALTLLGGGTQQPFNHMANTIAE